MFTCSYLMFINLIDVSFSHANSGKQTLLVDIYLKWELKCDCVIGNNIAMTFALFNQSEEYRSARKKECDKKKGVAGAKANIKKEILNNIYI